MWRYTSAIKSRRQDGHFGLLMKRWKRKLHILCVVQREGDQAFLALAGGGGKRSENQREATAREWKEETNLSVKIGRLLALLVRSDKAASMVVFEVTKAQGKLKADGKEILECRWLSLEEVWKHRKRFKEHHFSAIYQILEAKREKSPFPINGIVNGAPTRKQWGRIIRALDKK